MTPHPNPPHEPRDQTNRLTPHPGPLPFEGRGRPHAAVQGFNARSSSGKSLPSEGRGKRFDGFVLSAAVFSVERRSSNCPGVRPSSGAATSGGPNAAVYSEIL